MKKVLHLFIILIFLGSVNAFAQTPATKYYLIKADKVEKTIKKKNLIVLDVRTPEEVAKGTLPGAVNYNFDAPDFEKLISALPKNIPYLVYCQSSKRSHKAIEIMKALGFTKMYEMEGGMLAYDIAKQKSN